MNAPARARLASLLAALLFSTLAFAQNGNQNSADAEDGASSSSNQRGTLQDSSGSQGSIKLRQTNGNSTSTDAQDPYGYRLGEQSPGRQRPYVASEFERYVQQQAQSRQGNAPKASDGRTAQREAEIRRFGADLVTDDTLSPAQGSTQDPLPAVPADYIVKPGDEVQLTLWGTVDADLRLVVDRSGRITIPRVGAVPVAGLRHEQLSDAISRRVAQVFRNFQLTATVGRLRAVRVFVTGYAQRPGSLTVSGLSSVLHVLMKAGGPSAAGSFRDITLRRAGREAARFDLYDLLLKGDRSADQMVQPDDVIHIGPSGPQVGVIGSVNQQAVFELKAGETLADALRMAGGFNAVADRSRVAVERLADRANGRVAEVSLPAGLGQTMGSGDLVRAFSAISATLPRERQNKRVRVEGEVARPGDYVLPPGSSVADALRAAGGLTSAAYVFGTEFSRESVRQAQQENYDRALRDLETDMAKNQAGRRVASSEEAATQANSSSANSKLIERLRQVRPTGRVVLQLDPAATELPDLALEDGDRLSIPSRGTSVGVFGSVFNSGSFVFETGKSAEDYLKLAGGPTRGADKDSIFLIRANGSVVSANQGHSFWSSSTAFSSLVAQPGDTVFVPEDMNKTTRTQDAKDWTQILYQFGLGMAGIKSLGL